MQRFCAKPGFSPLNGDDKDSYNDIGHSAVGLSIGKWEPFRPSGYELAPHSVNILQLRE